jgi:hypothetical protein
MTPRHSFGYVIGIDGAKISLNLSDGFRGTHAGEIHGVMPVTETGALFGVENGANLIVMRVQALYFAEPRDAQTSGADSSGNKEPLRNVEASVVGKLVRENGEREFVPDSLISPALGARAFPLSTADMAAVLCAPNEEGPVLRLGRETRSDLPVEVSLAGMLSRHAAILGSTGQGKSSFTAAMLQQVAKLKNPRVVIFDINGEFEHALRGNNPPHVPENKIKVTKLGEEGTTKIPYYALGRSGLSRLLMPSEKTQRPALNFALDSLQHVKWIKETGGACLADQTTAILYDDARPGDAGTLSSAREALDKLRSKSNCPDATVWPHMQALAALAAESHSLVQGNRSMERNAFQYGNVVPMLNKLKGLIGDDLFTKLVDVEGGAPSRPGKLSWQHESDALVERIFGGDSESWTFHIVNLRAVAHDLLPLVLSSLLELFANRVFTRGQGKTYPTLLVLEEAHHYLREIGPGDDSPQNTLAYERLAKEGRKFGISLWLSTQRPSEVSPTVLAQCGSWIVFRLASELDLKAVANAAEWVDHRELRRIAGLPRQQAIAVGSCVRTPIRFIAETADPTPESRDPDFNRWLLDPPAQPASDVPPPPPSAAPKGPAANPLLVPKPPVAAKPPFPSLPKPPQPRAAPQVGEDEDVPF